MGPEMTAPSPTSKPASRLKSQATGHLVVVASSSSTSVKPAQPQTEQAVASLSPSAGSSPIPSRSGSQDIGAWNGAYEVAEN
ncbi:uncharacterized protein N7500_009987 [Penicillium coprophilum]|uniref:uncharacterized protein n=1 Tax=Penicillium coprophilum TaxID=36646 RepID=UPI002394F079|nr:uncharacterized protein N7500_009987 [Penicillium coprophilum]KAJ5154548.1 hypothetical protein N7500_009987 [Penicillium coprophilum]